MTSVIIKSIDMGAIAIAFWRFLLYAAMLTGWMIARGGRLTRPDAVDGGAGWAVAQWRCAAVLHRRQGDQRRQRHDDRRPSAAGDRGVRDTAVRRAHQPPRDRRRARRHRRCRGHRHAVGRHPGVEWCRRPRCRRRAVLLERLLRGRQAAERQAHPDSVHGRHVVVGGGDRASSRVRVRTGHVTSHGLRLAVSDPAPVRGWRARALVDELGHPPAAAVAEFDVDTADPCAGVAGRMGVPGRALDGDPTRGDGGRGGGTGRDRHRSERLPAPLQPADCPTDAVT